MEQIHATAIAIGEAGVLLLGASGIGKSDLALRLIDGGASLVADDRVDIHRDSSQVFLCPPPALHGLMEVRGLGIVKLPAMERVELTLVVELVSGGRIDRLPQQRTHLVAGCAFPAVYIDPFEVSAPAKVRLALKLADGTAETFDDQCLLVGDGG